MNPTPESDTPQTGYAPNIFLTLPEGRPPTRYVGMPRHTPVAAVQLANHLGVDPPREPIDDLQLVIAALTARYIYVYLQSGREARIQNALNAGRSVPEIARAFADKADQYNRWDQQLGAYLAFGVDKYNEMLIFHSLVTGEPIVEPPTDDEPETIVPSEVLERASRGVSWRGHPTFTLESELVERAKRAAQLIKLPNDQRGQFRDVDVDVLYWSFMTNRPGFELTGSPLWQPDPVAISNVRLRTLPELLDLEWATVHPGGR